MQLSTLRSTALGGLLVREKSLSRDHFYAWVRMGIEQETVMPLELLIGYTFSFII
jgi:hypothetical protein